MLPVGISLSPCFPTSISFMSEEQILLCLCQIKSPVLPPLETLLLLMPPGECLAHGIWWLSSILKMSAKISFCEEQSRLLSSFGLFFLLSKFSLVLGKAVCTCPSGQRYCLIFTEILGEMEVSKLQITFLSKRNMWCLANPNQVLEVYGIWQSCAHTCKKNSNLSFCTIWKGMREKILSSQEIIKLFWK